MLQLLTRQFDVTSGELYIGDSPITQWTEKGLRESISVVSQRVDILNGTLKDNLHLAKPDANDIELLSILKQVGLEYLNEGLGLDTWLGDGGRQLSGGEKRRVGIARALLHNAPILLLDEPTEGLDKQTENQIMQLLNQHSKGKTVVFVTHRLVGLDRMDSICLMEQGKIVEQGYSSRFTGSTRFIPSLTSALIRSYRFRFNEKAPWSPSKVTMAFFCINHDSFYLNDRFMFLLI